MRSRSANAASIQILGCRVDAAGRAAALERVVELAHQGRGALVVTLGTEMVMEAQRNPEFRKTIDRAALSLCDTIGLLLASRLRGGPLRERVTGVELVSDLAERSGSEDLNLYLLGGRPGVAQRAAERLRERFANVRIVGVRDGYFPADASESVAAAVAASGANVLLVGLGSPKQELWLERYLPATGCGVGIGVGGSFDVVAGTVKRAPELWQRLGLEWLYRLVREPRRWRRQLALPRFAVSALVEAAAARSGRTERS